MAAFSGIYMVVGVPEKLRLWWRSFDVDETNTIREKLGRMVDLLRIPPNRSLIQALVPFWCPSRAVFKFKNFELTPTLGEIAGLVGLQCQGKEMILPRNQSGKKFQDSLGLKKNDRLGCFENNWVSLDYLYERFGHIEGFKNFSTEFQCSKETWRNKRIRAFVIAFLGTLVFPIESRNIRTCIGSVVRIMFEGLQGKEPTVVPMILAEIYRALNKCRRGHRRYFQGCNLLLQMWALEQVCQRDPRMDIFYLYGNPITSQNKRIRRFQKPKSFQEWYYFLANLTDEQVMWSLSWVSDNEIILRPSNRYYIELVGLTGLQPYAPLRVLRQFGIEQVIPLCANMSSSEVEFVLKKEIPRKREILNDWNSLEPVKVELEQRSCTTEYLAWIKEDQNIIPSSPGKDGFEDIDMAVWIKFKLGIIVITPTQLSEIIKRLQQSKAGSTSAST